MLDHATPRRSRPATPPAEHPVRPLSVLAVGATAFTVLLVLVLTGWAPLRSLDRTVYVEINQLVATSDAAAAVLRVVTDLGDPLLTAAVLSVLTVVLLLRRLPRLAAWVAVTGLGLTVLDPLVKGLVERDRPSLPVAVATAPGYSFPSGHALASFATFAVLLLVALPALPRARRVWALVATGVVIAAVGFSRVALGVHYVSDVLAGWGLSAAWVATTALVLRARQVQQHEDPPRLRDGLEPHAAVALEPAPEGDAPLGGRPRRTLLLLVAGLAGVMGMVGGLGVLLTEVLSGTWVERLDRSIVTALATLGNPALETPAAIVNQLGGTKVITVVALSAAIIAVAALRRWRPAVFLLVSLLGEVAVYLVVSRVLVERTRPPVGPSSPVPDLASYPSGHAAAAMTLYGAIALVLHVHAHGRWRTVALVVPVVIGVLVALGRLYRGVHYPTDVLASALLSVTWLAITYRLVLTPSSSPGDGRGGRSGPASGSAVRPGAPPA